MMRSEIIKPLVIVLSLFLMAAYIALNIFKLERSFNQWGEISSSVEAPIVRLTLDNELVHQQRLKASEIFDGAGEYQIYFIRLPQGGLSRLREGRDKARLIIGRQEVSISRMKDNSRLFVRMPGRMIYLLADDDLKSMMVAIWNEQGRPDKFIQCTTTVLCDSLNFSSSDWRPLDGPYLDTEIRTDRRNMPRGRWSAGPKMVMDIQSGKQQKVLAMISILRIQQDQQLAFRGAAVTKAKKVKGDVMPLAAGGLILYPTAYVVQLDLQPGSNALEVVYSKWSKPVREGALPLAAYVTAIRVKAVN